MCDTDTYMSDIILHFGRIKNYADSDSQTIRRKDHVRKEHFVHFREINSK